MNSGGPLGIRARAGDAPPLRCDRQAAVQSGAMPTPAARDVGAAVDQEARHVQHTLRRRDTPLRPTVVMRTFSSRRSTAGVVLKTADL